MNSVRPLGRLPHPICDKCRASMIAFNIPRSRNLFTSKASLAVPSQKGKSPLSKYLDKRPENPDDWKGNFQKILSNDAGTRASKDYGIPVHETERRFQNTHRLCVFTHKHNTHLTLSTPDSKPLISLSCGNLGFRKANRGTYEASYQTAALSLKRIQERGHLSKIAHMEVAFRGFGPGRDAVTKCLLGPEGRSFRNKIVRVVDATRVKFGGTRSPRPRRLG